MAPGRTAATLRASRRMLRAEPEVLRAIQTHRLRAVVQVAARVEPYRSRGNLQEVTGTEDLLSMPPLDRSVLAAVPMPARIVPGPDAIERRFSSGTSGRFIEAAWSAAEDVFQRRLMLRQLEAQGVNPRARTLFLSAGHRFRSQLHYDRGRHTIGAFVPIDEVAAAFRSVRPELLVGPPSVLAEIAAALGPRPVGAVLTVGETLTKEARRELREAFSAEPLDLYASIESGNISWECVSRAGYHVNADAVIVEIVDEEDRHVSAGVIGRVVITALWNRTAPILRYRTGDEAALLQGPCPCGITLPLMGPVHGRSMDRVVASNGRRLSPFRVLIGSLIPAWAEAVHRYRVIQRGTGDFLVEARWRNGRREDLIARIAPAYEAVLGGPMRVEVRDVESFPITGKFRLVESRIVGRSEATDPVVAPPSR